MSEIDRGTDRVGRRGKRFLSPSQKYEIWLQLVRQEVTIAEAAACPARRPLDDHADPHGREGGCAGGVGGATQAGARGGETRQVRGAEAGDVRGAFSGGVNGPGTACRAAGSRGRLPAGRKTP